MLLASQIELNMDNIFLWNCDQVDSCNLINFDQRVIESQMRFYREKKCLSIKRDNSNESIAGSSNSAELKGI